MRMLILALTLLSLSLSLTAQDKNIVLIPDTLFKAYLVEHFDANKDGEINRREAERITEIRCNNQGIRSLDGIEQFTNLLTLYCAKNKLNSLDLSGNNRIVTVVAFGNPLVKLSVKGAVK
ncbi:hypothetical protein SFC43_34890 [Bacteroides sp. CR5/BHMF/2]|nr:hypothetical protein [Bacteroides sp. CR5/BHMF/2]